MARGPAWSAEEDRTLIEMRRAGRMQAAIAKALGRTEKAVSSRVAWLGMRRDGTLDTDRAADRRAKGIEIARTWRIKQGQKPRSQPPQVPPERYPPPDTRDLTGYLMGDPLPGRSALDRVSP